MGKKVFKAVKKVVSTTVVKPFQAVGDAVVKTVTEPLKLVSDAITPKLPSTPDPIAPAAPAPDPEQTATDMQTQEGIGRRKKNGRASLRIDLNTGGAPTGNGVNVPRG